MALFRALQGIAPHFDAAMVLNVCEGVGLIVSVRDHEGQILHASDAAVAQLTSDDATEPGGLGGLGGLRYFDEHGGELGRDQLPYELVRQTGDDRLNVVFRVDGPRGALWLQMSFIALARGDAGYSVLGIGSDITARREAETVLRRMATHDGLTGLLNRVGLLRRVEPQFMEAATISGRFALLLLDVDHFKAINDDHGHAAGDAVLAAIATTIKATLPPGAAAGRWGGEEFVIACPGADRSRAIEVAELLRRAVSDIAVPLAGLETAPAGADAVVRVTVSLGVAADPTPGMDFHALARRADEALYMAKRAGRDRVAA